jgi:hypothetical protein
MVELGVMGLTEAFGDLVEDIAAYRAIARHFDDIDYQAKAKRLRAWRRV